MSIKIIGWFYHHETEGGDRETHIQSFSKK